MSHGSSRHAPREFIESHYLIKLTGGTNTWRGPSTLFNLARVHNKQKVGLTYFDNAATKNRLNIPCSQMRLIITPSFTTMRLTKSNAFRHLQRSHRQRSACAVRWQDRTSRPPTANLLPFQHPGCVTDRFRQNMRRVSKRPVCISQHVFHSSSCH